MVVPRLHISRIADLDAATASGIWATAILIGSVITKLGGEAVGVNLQLSDGEIAGQEVEHVHVHVIPRRRDDGYHVDAEAWRGTAPSRKQLEESNGVNAGGAVDGPVSGWNPVTVDAVERVNRGLTDGDLAASLHKTLGRKVSPTMAAGISDHLWTVEEICRLLESN